MIPGTIDLDRLLDRPTTTFDEAGLNARYAGSTALVTGAGGSIGGALCEELLARGARSLVCVDSHEPSLFRLGLRLRERWPAIRPRLALADVRQTDLLARLMSDHGVDAVFHTAAYKHVPLAEENADQALAVNVLATLDLADAAIGRGVRDFVYPSTDKAVRPPSIYGATKRLAEIELLRRRTGADGRRVAVARLVNVFGTAGNVIEIFAAQMQAGRHLTVTDRAMTRYWMTRREAVRLMLSAALIADADGPLMIDVGAAAPLLDTARRLAALLSVPMPPVDEMGWRPGERLTEELTYPEERLVSSDAAGVLIARSERPLGDVTDLVGEARRVVAAADADAARAQIGAAIRRVAVI